MQAAVQNPSSNTAITTEGLLESLQLELAQFQRYKEINDRRVLSIKQELTAQQAKIESMNQIIAKYREKEVVQEARDKLANYNKGGEHRLDQPIDRNGVAPKDVVLANIFNFSGKRF